jgi:RNA polymerase sigma-70 factor (ECF subfamily)
MISTEFTESTVGNNLGVIVTRDNSARPHSSWNRTGPAAPHRGESPVRKGEDLARPGHVAIGREAVKMDAVRTRKAALDGDDGSIASTQDSLEEGAEQTLQPSANERAEECSSEPSDPRARILALYDEFRPRLYRYMRSMHLGQDQADEVIQETFMRLTAELLKRNQIENVPGWIVRVAHNLAIDLMKREQGPVVATESAAFLIGNRVDPSLNPEDAYAKKEQSWRMTNALSTLNPQHRQCFQMRAQGLRYRDIGLALGISEQRAAFVVKQVAVRLATICG